RSLRDWSSDVCSSDLFWEALSSRPFWRGALLALELTTVSFAVAIVIGFFLALGRGSRSRAVRGFVFFYTWVFRATPTLLQLLFRSEERRVGKGCRCRW